MPLQESRRTQLDDIVMKMRSNREPDSNIQFVVDDFKRKYENEVPPAPIPEVLQPRPIPGIPGMGGENLPPYRVTRPADIPAPEAPENPSFGQMIFPSTMGPKAQTQQPIYAPDSSGRIEGYVPVAATSGFEPVGDLASLPTRALGSATDPILPGNARGDNADGSRKSFRQGMANPDAGIMRPAREGIAESIKTAWEYAKDDEKPYLMRSLAALMGEAAAVAYLGVSAVEDPTILIPAAATPKAVAMAERLAPKVQAAGNALAEAPNKLAGRLSQEMSGVREEALRMASTPEGRKTLEAAAGQQNTVGQELVRLIDQADDAIPERLKVEEALAKMGDMDLQVAVDALEAAKVKPVGGRILLPNEKAANAKIDTYIEAIRGRDLPEDLGAAARGARKNLSRTAAEAEDLTDLSKLAGKDAAEAAAAQRAARSDMGKAANRIKTLKKNETDFGWWHDQARDEAKAAAQATREASLNVEAAGAVKGVRTQDADAAKAAVTAAERNYAVADAAAQIYAGKPIKEVAQGLIKTHKLRGDDLRQALDRAKKKATSQPEAPDLTVPAPEFRKLRRRLDVNIDFNSEEGALVNEALKSGRFSMKDALIQKARESGNPEYEKWMRTWADKLDKIDELKVILGSNDRMRKQRAERFIGTLFGKNTTEKRQLVKDLDDIFGSDIMGKAQNSIMAGELGPGGKATWFPTNATGRSTLGFVVAKGLSIPFSSPIIASRITLPMATRLEKVLKFTGGTLTGRSQAALRAMMKTRNAVVQGRLMNLIETEIPSNAVPFKRVAGGEQDKTRTDDRRYAGR